MKKNKVYNSTIDKEGKEVMTEVTICNEDVKSVVILVRSIGLVLLLVITLWFWYELGKMAGVESCSINL